ncbi:MAG TPA: nuclear transport factor 2 family protein [Myxococcota bacterium]|nr:nuclear transport factor 2 family protein [Myxococcota bacterium]
MADRIHSLAEIQDRFAILDLYDRQLAAAEAFDLARYDTTFAEDARVDLSDFGRPACLYPEYRRWLAGLREVMIRAQRVMGGLRLELDGDRAFTRVPVVCHVRMRVADKETLSHTGLFYNDELARRSEGWRIVSRLEELSWSDSSRGAGSPAEGGAGTGGDTGRGTPGGRSGE